MKKKSRGYLNNWKLMLTACSALPLLVWPALAQRVGVTFTDVAANDGAGIGYRRGPSPSEALFDAFKREKPTHTFGELQTVPMDGRGAPGVALFDFDRDGDLDIYVTNGPGRSNSLYANQVQQTGELTFVDVADSAGVAAADQDSTGVCFGDLDNDGDEDLFVLGNAQPNRLFENEGGAFVDVTAHSGLGGGTLGSVSCSMGDIDGDGLLDIAVANTFDMRTQRAISSVPVALNQPNQLFSNQGGNVFVDVAAEAGFLDLYLPQGAPKRAATISWALALVDVDQDGDVDIVQADDQGAIPIAALGGLDRGFLQLFENDGRGAFTNVSAERALDRVGSWMGLSFGDFDRNGALDVFATNFGNQFIAGLTGNTRLSKYSQDSRWFLQQQDGTFRDRFDQGFLQTPFGWGTSAADYDNDGDTDILFYGGLDAGVGVVVSPGVLLNNDGQGHFRRDLLALSNDHRRRSVYGLATGDLDNDGFIDIVSVSNFNIPPSIPLFPVPPLGNPDFDQDAAFVATFNPVDAQGSAFSWSGFEFPDGTLSVERNSADNGNRAIVVRPLGTVGLTSRGRVNRDGIGAVLRLTPAGLDSDLRPILGGSSYASQDAPYAYFGMGTAATGDLEVLWPGGTRNRLLGVRAGERLVFPEIPCSLDDQFSDPDYANCVSSALAELVRAGVLSDEASARWFKSATTERP